jgi:FixJ family two-component response regulator
MSAQAPALVSVVDDDPSVRRSLARLVKGAGYRVEAYASAHEFLARPPEEGPACLLLDVRMPGLTGLDLQETLAIAAHSTSIVFITGYRDVRASVKAMKAGAVDFLTKPVDDEELLGAIERAVARASAARVEEDRVTEIRERIKTLTPREAEVFALVVTGMLNKQIAFDLGVSEKMVKVHRGRVMEKMRARSLAELVRLADEGGVISAKP